MTIISDELTKMILQSVVKTYSSFKVHNDATLHNILIINNTVTLHSSYKAILHLECIQVEATTEKRPMVIRGNGLFFRDTKCTEIPGRPELTGICAMIS